MADLDRAIAAAREAVARVDRECSRTDDDAYMVECARAAARLVDLLAALDAARGEAVWQVESQFTVDGWIDYKSEKVAREVANGRAVRCLYAAPPAALAVPADNVTPMRQPRADLARLVESINAAVYANGDGLSVTEAIGALELAKLELLKEQEQ